MNLEIGNRQPAIGSSARLVSIDALRGVAALGVVLYHAVLQSNDALPQNLFQWPFKAVQFLSSFGYVGVFLFFVISGFCIHLQWARARAAGQPGEVRFLSFWKRRVRRLYPPYLITLALFLLMMAFSVGIDVTRFFLYDMAMHVLMLHNLDPATAYSINGVFWTLAVEEQLYLAYFPLLFLRKRWGWGPTLLICAGARVGWYVFSHLIWLRYGVGIPVPEAALSHWFTWGLGAVAVEAALGLIRLPAWCRNLWLSAVALVAGSTLSVVLPQIPKDTWLHDATWLLMHPLWGFGFFVLINRAVAAEKSWANLKVPALVAAAAVVGVFSYSLYLTHELVIMQFWRFYFHQMPPILNTLLVLTPATVIFAWLFFCAFEKPFLRKQVSGASPAPPEPEPITSTEALTPEPAIQL